LFGIILTARFLWPKQAPRALSKDVIYFLWAAVALGIVVSLQRHLWLAGAVLVTIWLLVLPKVDRARLWHPLSRALAACAIGLFVALGAVVVWSGHLPLQAAHVVQVLRERTSLNLILNQEDSSARWRFAAWRAGLGLWVGQPIVGTGLGQEIFGYNQIYPFQVAARELHNDYLGILIQLGLVGLAAVVYWFVVIVRTMVSAWQRERTPLLFVSGSMLLLFFMIFGVSIYWDTNFFVMWWWLALAGLRFSSTDV
jgi:O-antigen ligase